MSSFLTCSENIYPCCHCAPPSQLRIDIYPVQMLLEIFFLIILIIFNLHEQKKLPYDDYHSYVIFYNSIII